jgi:hypothetical protein
MSALPRLEGERRSFSLHEAKRWVNILVDNFECLSAFDRASRHRCCCLVYTRRRRRRRWWWRRRRRRRRRRWRRRIFAWALKGGTVDIKGMSARKITHQGTDTITRTHAHTQARTHTHAHTHARAHTTHLSSEYTLKSGALSARKMAGAALP